MGREQQRVYVVFGRFPRARGRDRLIIERWIGPASSMTVALRRAILAIMRRPTVRRKRHQTMTFTVDFLERSV